MKTYEELKQRLCKIGWKDVSRNYSGGGCYMLMLGYGHNEDPWPRTQLRVIREQWMDEDGLSHFEDWLMEAGARVEPVRSLEQVWCRGCELANRELAARAPIYPAALRAQLFPDDDDTTE